MTWYLSTKTAHPYLDDPEKWDADSTAPAFGVRAYQNRLDKIVGKNRERKSIARLVYAPQVTSPFFSDIPRYWNTRTKDGEDWLYNTVKRWMFEVRLERGAYFDSWNKTRYSRKEPDYSLVSFKYAEAEWAKNKGDKEGAARLILQAEKLAKELSEGGEVIDKGPPPEEFYAWFYTVAEHDPNERCCARLFQKERKVCWGYYRLPNDLDLRKAAKAVRERDMQKGRNPYQPLSTQELYDIERRAMDVTRQEEVQVREQRLAEISEFTRKNVWRLGESDTRVLKHGRTSMGDPLEAMKFKRTPAGIIVPN